MRNTIFIELIECDNKDFAVEIFQYFYKNQNSYFRICLLNPLIENDYNMISFLNMKTLEKKSIKFKNELTYNLNELKQGSYKIQINNIEKLNLYISE